MFHSELYNAFEPIQTARLMIRKLGIGDADDIFAFSKDPMVSRYVLWDTHRSIADSRAMLRGVLRAYRNDEPASLGIVLQKTGRVVGTIGFLWVDQEHNCAEIGYSIGRAYWGQGLMPEALWAMIRFGMEEMHLNRIEAQFDTRNIASGRVMQKCGMKSEGILRQRMYNKGEYIDVEVQSILSSEYEMLKAEKEKNE